MKKILFTLCMFALANSFQTYASYTETENPIETNSEQSPEFDIYLKSGSQLLAPGNSGGGLFLDHNILKINLASLALMNISIQYEYLIGDKISVALGLRYMPSGNIPYKNILTDLLIDQADYPELLQVVDNTKLNSFAITPEFRYYFKSAGKGSYIAPFLRYDHFSLSTNLNTDINGNNYDINFDGGLTRYGLGILYGTQFELPGNFYFDWWIAGPYINMSQFNLNASGFTINDADFDQYESMMNNLNLSDYGLKTNIEVTKNSASLKSNNISFGARTFGLCLGYRF